MTRRGRIVCVLFCLLLIFIMSFWVASLDNWARFYNAVNEWELEPPDEIWFDRSVLIYDAITIDLRHIYGKVYVIDENGDTVFRYTKERK